jgi:hypothetical protein
MRRNAGVTHGERQETDMGKRLAGRPTLWGDPFRRANAFWGGVLLFIIITGFNLYKTRHPFAGDDWAMCIPGVLLIFGYNHRG